LQAAVSRARLNERGVYCSGPRLLLLLLLQRGAAVATVTPVPSCVEWQCRSVYRWLPVLMWYAAAAAVAADYMAETALFVALVCFMLIADRPGGSLMETVSQCVTTIGIGPAVG